MMDLFSLLFLSFFAISLVTGTAYHRGAIHRSERPLDYWVTTVGYLLIGLLIAFPGIMRRIKGL
ncbi:hypothetical protein JQX13_49800 [Archangium violaceum]|uniref:hypothetical protein n=1 Tax=Archangium violaceum TaxID=83451 RepID=UPI00193C79E1|nr:hypothetical protein [Archangium violaceum]QRK07970.1 hypothetical protein JQX13_49800 [Archangium violaceum]